MPSFDAVTGALVQPAGFMFLVVIAVLVAAFIVWKKKKPASYEKLEDSIKAEIQEIKQRASVSGPAAYEAMMEDLRKAQAKLAALRDKE